jgi:hypothetical protein
VPYRKLGLLQKFWEFFSAKFFRYVYLFIYKVDMKLKITISQLREILKTEVPKFPVEIMMSKVDQSELLKIGNLLKKKN